MSQVSNRALQYWARRSAIHAHSRAKPTACCPHAPARQLSPSPPRCPVHTAGSTSAGRERRQQHWHQLHACAHATNFATPTSSPSTPHDHVPIAPDQGLASSTTASPHGLLNYQALCAPEGSHTRVPQCGTADRQGPGAWECLCADASSNALTTSTVAGQPAHPTSIQNTPSRFRDLSLKPFRVIRFYSYRQCLNTLNPKPVNPLGSKPYRRL